MIQGKSGVEKSECDIHFNINFLKFNNCKLATRAIPTEQLIVYSFMVTKFGIEIMLNKKKACILVTSISVLFYALVSPYLLPGVTIDVKDAIFISYYVVSMIFLIGLTCKREKVKLEQKIHLQHSQMETIINNAPFIMYLKDIDGTILLANHKISKLLGIDADEVIGKNINNFYSRHNLCLNEDKEIITTKNTLCIQREIETPKGTFGWCKLIKAPVLDDNGNVVSIVVIFQNIDKEKEIEERKNTFIATLTHDLKTPTIAQIKATELLLDNVLGEINDEQRDILTQIKKSCKYMYDLIFTILETYLYDEGQVKINRTNFCMPELIQEVIGEISNLMREKEQTIHISADFNMHEIYADKIQMKRVIINFIANAITYGQNKTDIDINVEENEDSLTFKVHNKSTYIPEEKLKDLYEKFKKAGTGLGLYLSKQIINAHKGEVFASSSKTGNCCFGFCIPKTTKTTQLEASYLQNKS